MSERGSQLADAGMAVAVDLIAVVVAVTAGDPRVLTIRNAESLPSGQFQTAHRSLQASLRGWVEAQTHHPLGYIEQLYTFADADRREDGGSAISISYLGLTRQERSRGDPDITWANWYTFFPWEDRRGGEPAIIRQTMLPRLQDWARSDAAAADARERRVAITFGVDCAWNEELVLQRYELLYEAELVPEALRRKSHSEAGEPVPGKSMILDHRRILATAIARLRAKIKYRPVFFELMADAFTLGQLQRAVEAIAGRQLHKQNFRRLIEQQELVEETGQLTQDTGGRPAKLFRFRRAVLAERGVTGTKVPLPRG